MSANKCIECDRPLSRQNVSGFCADHWNKADICKVEGCDNDIASTNRTGFCSGHARERDRERYARRMALIKEVRREIAAEKQARSRSIK